MLRKLVLDLMIAEKPFVIAKLQIENFNVDLRYYCGYVFYRYGIQQQSNAFLIIAAWHEWGPWTDCAGGMRRRIRSCENGEPGDPDCIGEEIQSEECEERELLLWQHNFNPSLHGGSFY